MNIYSESSILLAIFGSIGVLTAVFVLSYAFVWQGREEIRRKPYGQTNQTSSEGTELYFTEESTEDSQEVQQAS